MAEVILDKTSSSIGKISNHISQRRSASVEPGRRPSTSSQRQQSFGSTQGSPQRYARPSTPQHLGTKVRVEERRQVVESQFWGRESPTKRDLPAFWSVTQHGQPYNDPRLKSGSPAYYKVISPQPLKQKEKRPAGPAAEESYLLRRSLVLGKRLFKRSDLTPVLTKDQNLLIDVSDDEREWIISRMTPHQQLNALQDCLDRDINAENFLPWTFYVLPQLNATSWRRNPTQCVRLAVQELERLMRTHVQCLADAQCRKARAPFALTKDILMRAFWRVDPQKSGSVSLQQFLQVWQNILQLHEYEDKRGESMQKRSFNTRFLRPVRRRIVDRNAAAAIFIKYGFDRDGLLPYIVFVRALHESPARLLGHELILDKADQGKNGVSSEIDVSMLVRDAKIIYPKCKSGVFPPSGFDPRVAMRSSLLPAAHMYLEHVYGYSGLHNLSNNLYYTYNTTEDVCEVVYFTGMIGIVFNNSLHDSGKPSQRFFYGHDNDIQCLAIHPQRKFVATGQQLAPEGLPYVCVWEVDGCTQIQRLDHAQDCRSVIACCFSGRIDTPPQRGGGGSVLVTVTSDNQHTIHLWYWMTQQNKYCKATYIPGWCFGPSKKLNHLQAAGLFYQQNQREEVFSYQDALNNEYDSDVMKHPLILQAQAQYVDPVGLSGMHVEHKPMTADGTWDKIEELPGFQGTPPVVYGVHWNPFKPSDGTEGSEFLSYGVKHLKTWSMTKEGHWRGQQAQFGPQNVENVLSAIYIPALHQGAAPGDSCILTGFTAGQIGLWVPPFPTRPAAIYTLTQIIQAHQPGPIIRLNDGSQVHGGLRTLKLRADHRTVISGGADGAVHVWRIKPPQGTLKDGQPRTGVKIEPVGPESSRRSYWLREGDSSKPAKNMPMIKGLDAHPAKAAEFIVGTDDCDIWEVDKDPRVLVEGLSGDVTMCDMHPEYPDIFVTGDDSKQLIVWDSTKRDVVKKCVLGISIASVAFSREAYPASYIPGWQPGSSELSSGNPRVSYGYHIAAGGRKGSIIVTDAITLQPLAKMQHTAMEISEIKYSPQGCGEMMAVAAKDMSIYVYSVCDKYQIVSRCVGHSGSILHLDWSLPLNAPRKMIGKSILMAGDAAKELLYWDPVKGQQVTMNTRDVLWSSWTNRYGFYVMGIWADNSDATDINAVTRSTFGKPVYDSVTGISQMSTAAESSDGVPGCGYIATSDDFSFVKLFNFPAIWDDAPYRMYRGHSSHVSCVRFSSDDRVLISVGGFDRGVYQWKTLLINEDDQENDKAILQKLDQILRKRQLDESSKNLPVPLLSQ